VFFLKKKSTVFLSNADFCKTLLIRANQITVFHQPPHEIIEQKEESTDLIE